MSLSSTDQTVFATMCEFARFRDSLCFAAASSIGREAGVSSRTVWRCVARLEAAGLIERQGVRKIGCCRATTVWRIDPPKRRNRAVKTVDKPVENPVDDVVEKGPVSHNGLRPRSRAGTAFRFAQDAPSPRDRCRPLARSPRQLAAALVAARGWPTGVRATRGTHGVGVVYDPLGYERSRPRDWPHRSPCFAEIAEAAALRGSEYVRQLARDSTESQAPNRRRSRWT